MQQQDQLTRLQGASVTTADGEEVGKFEGLFYDVGTRRPEWIAVASGALGTKRTLVPFEGATADDDSIEVAYAAEQVRDAPDVDRDEISHELEQRLYDYYGLTAPQAQAQPPAGDASLVRSEEELHVGKEQVDAGRARLRKWVETEPVELDVELRRETARVRTEPVNEPVADVELGEQEVELPLTAEQPVVAKQAVAKERVTLERDVEVEHRRIEDEVRKERIDVDGDVR